MQLLINIGNTHVEISDQNLSTIERFKTADFISDPLDILTSSAHYQFDNNLPLFISSVVPKAEEALRTHCHDAQLNFLTWDKISSLIDFSEVNPTTIGADRLANALAAQAQLKLPAFVVDCGTCINSEFIDDKSRFLGGSIAPGRQLQRNILFQGTGQLPDVALNHEELHTLGRNTHEAIQAGIDLGLIAGIQKMIDTLSELQSIHCYFTGGDRQIFLDNIKGTQEAPKHLTLLGIQAFSKISTTDNL